MRHGVLTDLTMDGKYHEKNDNEKYDNNANSQTCITT